MIILLTSIFFQAYTFFSLIKIWVQCSRENIYHIKATFHFLLLVQNSFITSFMWQDKVQLLYIHMDLSNSAAFHHIMTRFNVESLMSWNMWQILPVFIDYLLFYDLTMRTWKLVFTFKDFKQWLRCVLVYTNWLTSKKNPKRRCKIPLELGQEEHIRESNFFFI